MITASLHHLRIPFRKPFGHVIATRDHAEAIVLVIDAGGASGVGECVPRPYVTGETFESVWDAILGLDLTGVWAKADGASRSSLARSVEQLALPERLRAGDVLGLAAGCAVELAVLDLRCKLGGWRLGELAFAMGLPAELLGEAPLHEIISVPLDLRTEPHELAHLAGSRLGHLKIKVGADLPADVRRVRECRRIFGSAISMSVDANMSWSVEEAVRAADALRPFQIAWYEEPLQLGERHRYRELRERGGVAVMLDEAACSFAQTRQAIEAGACDLVNIRLSKCGGYLASLRLAELARGAGVRFQHGTQVGQLGFLNAAGRHFTSLVKGIVACEGGPGLANLTDYPTLTRVELDWSAGHLAGLSGPGIGASHDPEKLRRHAIRSATWDGSRWRPAPSRGPGPRPRHADHPAAAPASGSGRLSTEQLRFYFLHQLDPSDPDIHICRTLRIAGALDHGILRDSVLDLARRHDILRSSYPDVDGQPRSCLRDDVGAAHAMIDLSRLAAPERAARADELISNELRIRDPFRLDEAPLFRVTAIQLGDLEHVVVLRFHHIVVDGASVQLFLDGLWETYAGLCSGKRLERPSHQFRDYVEWETRRLADRTRAEDREYWANKLARPAVLDLTLGGPRPARHTGEADTVHALAGPRLRASLKAACKELRVTPYVVMMSVFQILLHAITGQRDVLVGTPIASRQRVELQPMLGVLVSWIAFRTHVRPGMTFRDVLAQVRDEFPEAYLRQCSYEALLSAAGSLPRDPARNPLFQVTLNHATYKELAAPPGLTIELDPIASTRTRYDLAVRIEEIGDSLSLGLTYYRGAMARGAAEELAATLLALAEHYAEHPDRAISDARLGLAAPAPTAAPAPAAPPAPRRIVIAATFTAEQIRPALDHWLAQVELPSEIELAPPGQVFQALLLPGGLVAANQLGTSVLLVRLEDWKDPASATGELCRLLAAHAERTAADTIVVVCPPRAASRGGERAAERELLDPPDRLDRLDRLEREIAGVAEACPRLHFLSWRTILSLYPVEVIDDPESDAYAQAPYSEDFNVALGTAIARKIHAVVRPGPKVLLLDCDNTLWRGVVGEDGPGGIEIDPGRRELQQLAADRLGAGVLLGLVSKNNEADVWEAFEAAPGMVLRREMIVAHRINWEPKSRNIQALAAELNLGVDSFVFIDDSPAECAEVRAACPGVLVLQLPAEPEAISRFVRHLWPLDLRKVTDTDRRRAAMYAANARREQLRSATTDLHRFVASLEVRTTLVPFSKETAARAAQMTQRTNQFNTTTIRRSEAELRAIVDGGAELLLADVSDRFGDYGIVGLVVYRRGPEALEVDTLLLSCRALGRGVEQRILAELGRIAADRGLAVVEIPYRRTAKNRPAFQFLEAMAGPHRLATGTDGHHVYRVPVSEALAAADRLVAAEVPAEEAAPASRGPVEAAVSGDLWRRIATELDSIPRIRAQLAASLARTRSAETAYVAPRDQLERSIARVWSEVLLVELIGATDDYFAIGGDSIRSLAVVSRMRRAGLPVTVLELHEHPTVARLAELLRARASRDLAPAPPPAAPSGDGPYPLSFSQDYLVRAYARDNLARRGEPGGAFHIQARLILREQRGRPSMDALRRAVELMVRRTAILRTRIFRDGDRWMQAEIAASPAFEVVDLSGLADAEQQDRIDQLLLADRLRPFDPERSGAPMIRFHAIVRSAARFELAVAAHHGFCDGWSLQGFYSRLVTLYQAFRDGDGARIAEIDRALAAHERSFRELVHHEQHAPGAAQSAAFWRTYLSGRLPAPAAAEAAPAGAPQQLIARGDWRLVERAHERARSSGTSLKAVLLEAFSAALARRSSARSPQVIAVVTNGRRDDLTAPTEVFGLCWTFVPIVSTPGDRRTRLTALHRDLIATEAHARHPVEGMFQGRDPAAVARASFNLTNFHDAGWQEDTEDLEITQAESFTSFRFPLDFQIRLVERARSVVLKAGWPGDALDRDAARGLLDDLSADLAPHGRGLEIE